MTWAPIYGSLFGHPKLLRATAALRCDRYKLAGHLARLWSWAVDAVGEDGGPLTADEIAVGADWPKSAEGFTEALAEAGLLDRLPDGRFEIHEWGAYGGRLAARRRKEAERQRRGRASRHGGRTRDDGATSARSSNGAYADRVDPNRFDLNRSDHTPLPPDLPDSEGVRRRLWAIHEDLDGTSTPTALDDQQFDDWLDRCPPARLNEHIDAALAAVRSWSPDRPWHAFKADLGRRIATAPAVGQPPEEPRTLTAAEVLDALADAAEERERAAREGATP